MNGDVDYCPTCGISHNPWMSCATARRLHAERAGGLRCPDCGHVHTDQTLAGICVGCPCPWRPPGAIAVPVRSLGECNTLPLFSDQGTE